MSKLHQPVALLDKLAIAPDNPYLSFPRKQQRNMYIIWQICVLNIII